MKSGAYLERHLFPENCDWPNPFGQGRLLCMLLEARIEPLPDRTAVIAFSGPMTLGSSLKVVDAQVQSALAEGLACLVFDMSGVEYVDSAGLGLLVHTFGLLNGKGGALRICCVQPRLRAMLHTTKTDTILAVDATREESLAALKKSRAPV
jgi:anti-sigma B factor antagonist